MKNSFTEKRKCFGGSTNVYKMTETNEWGGQTLGAELTPEHQIEIASCDHIESEDEEGIEIDRGVWVKKSLVKSVTWQIDAATKCSTVARIAYARPI